jgi:hypothetical protein
MKEILTIGRIMALIIKTNLESIVQEIISVHQNEIVKI